MGRCFLTEVAILSYNSYDALNVLNIINIRVKLNIRVKYNKMNCSGLFYPSFFLIHRKKDSPGNQPREGGTETLP
jgi:hypothetical protein